MKPEFPVETGNPGTDGAGFRRTLGEFATGVTVVTTCVDGVTYGVTSNSFASVSLDPPMILWSIRRDSTSLPAFNRCSHFAVNVLAADQMAVSQRFARSGPAKFDGIDWRPGDGGAPLLADTTASLECLLAETYDGGDHLILLGQVERFIRHDRQPLLFAKGRYAVAADHPETRAVPGPQVAAAGQDEQLLSLLLVRAYSALASRLERARKAAGLGLSLMEARLLKSVQAAPGSTLGELQPELLVDPVMARELLASLIGQGLLVDTPEGVHMTPEGAARIRAVTDHARDGEVALFKGVEAQDIATVQRVLNRIIAA